MLPVLGPRNPPATRSASGRRVRSIPPTRSTSSSICGGTRGENISPCWICGARPIQTVQGIQRSSVDYYSSLRSLYRQLRANEIRNGRPETQGFAGFLTQLRYACLELAIAHRDHHGAQPGKTELMLSSDLTPGMLPLARRALLALWSHRPARARPASASASAPRRGLRAGQHPQGSGHPEQQAALDRPAPRPVRAFPAGLTDMKRIALFTLGQYRRTAPPQDLDAFAAAFQNYAVAVYQSYFSKYTGQTLKVIGSQPARAHRLHRPDPADRSQRQQRAAAAGSGFPRAHRHRQARAWWMSAYPGIWLSLEERDQFVAFLGQNNGNVRTLIAHLSDWRVNSAASRRRQSSSARLLRALRVRRACSA